MTGKFHIVLLKSFGLVSREVDFYLPCTVAAYSVAVHALSFSYLIMFLKLEVG